MFIQLVYSLFTKTEISKTNTQFVRKLCLCHRIDRKCHIIIWHTRNVKDKKTNSNKKQQQHHWFKLISIQVSQFQINSVTFVLPKLLVCIYWQWIKTTCLAVSHWQDLKIIAVPSWQYLRTVSVPTWQYLKTIAVPNWQYLKTVAIPNWHDLKTVSVPNWQYLITIAVPNWQYLITVRICTKLVIT